LVVSDCELGVFFLASWPGVVLEVPAGKQNGGFNWELRTTGAFVRYRRTLQPGDRGRAAPVEGEVEAHERKRRPARGGHVAPPNGGS
jgi:hypothetical protein